MFAIPGLVLMLLFGYLRPQEFVPALRYVPFLYVFFAMALVGLVLDVRLRIARFGTPPPIGCALLFFVWAVLTILTRVPSLAMGMATELAIQFTFFLLLGYGVQSFRAFTAVAVTTLLLTLALAGVGAHQAFAPFGCVKVDPSSRDLSGDWDGRYCVSKAECGDEEDNQYVCEHIGLFGTTSVSDGRIRYRGALNDPNALVLALSVAVPFAFALYERRRSRARFLLLVFTILLVGFCVIKSGSRGGIAVFVTVLGVYFVKRYGPAGLLVGGLCALPVLIFGAAGRGDAEASSDERIRMMHDAVMLALWQPLRGVGYGQILEYNALTAHNSYALAAAETGFPGLVLWSGTLYLPVKVLVAITSRYVRHEGAAIARIWAKALLASSIGMAVGIFFLSFCYDFVYWVHIGFCAALYQACRTHDPEFEVRFDVVDLRRLVLLDAGLIFAIWAYTTVKLR